MVYNIKSHTEKRSLNKMKFKKMFAGIVAVLLVIGMVVPMVLAYLK